MASVELFLGFPVSSSFSEKLAKVSPEMRALCIQEGSEYLRQVNCEQGIVLGKYVGSIVDVDSLDLCQDHIISLLKKLVPDHPISPDSLILFPIPA